MQSLRDLKALLAELHTQATTADDTPERARARRELRVVAMGATEGTPDREYLALVQQYRLPGSGPGGR